MARPRIPRRIQKEPPKPFYRPHGVPLSRLQGLVIPLEGYEALRLVDGEGVDPAEAARMMGVSRPTLSRTLNTARALVARALMQGWAIRFEGGDYTLMSPCPPSTPGCDFGASPAG